MKALPVILCAIAVAGCAQQRVVHSLQDAAVVEGMEYAAEMEAQSPFDTVEMSWSEAVEQMELRNRTYIAARQEHERLGMETAEIGEITSEVRRSVTSSVGGALSPGAFINSVLDPANQLPKQLSSLAGLKDISHNVGQNAWQGAADSVDAELVMRRELVKLHRLLRTGELLDREIALLEDRASSGDDADPELAEAINGWRNELQSARAAWLAEVRDFFDAEYHDVRFIRDDAGLRDYRDVDQPDLADWERWCRLTRSKELVHALAESHAESQPAVPGSTVVTNRLQNLVNRDDGEPETSPAIRDSGAVRSEVRKLVKSWRNMKETQQQAARLESAFDEGGEITPPADVNQRRRIHQLRKAEVENTAVIWMMDEACWE